MTMSDECIDLLSDDEIKIIFCALHILRGSNGILRRKLNEKKIQALLSKFQLAVDNLRCKDKEIEEK